MTGRQQFQLNYHKSLTYSITALSHSTTPSAQTKRANLMLDQSEDIATS